MTPADAADASDVRQSPRLGANAAEHLAQQVNGAFVLVVETTAEHYRRRVFFSLDAAHRHAVTAARRGRRARIYLARLDLVTEVLP